SDLQTPARPDHASRRAISLGRREVNLFLGGMDGYGRDHDPEPPHQEFGTTAGWVINRDPQAYFGYFENELGEQFIFLATLDAVRLAGGDLGWDQVFQLVRP